MYTDIGRPLTQGMTGNNATHVLIVLLMSLAKSIFGKPSRRMCWECRPHRHLKLVQSLEEVKLLTRLIERYHWAAKTRFAPCLTGLTSWVSKLGPSRSIISITAHCEQIVYTKSAGGQSGLCPSELQLDNIEDVVQLHNLILRPLARPSQDLDLGCPLLKLLSAEEEHQGDALLFRVVPLLLEDRVGLVAKLGCDASSPEALADLQATRLQVLPDGPHQHLGFALAQLVARSLRPLQSLLLQDVEHALNAEGDAHSRDILPREHAHQAIVPV